MFRLSEAAQALSLRWTGPDVAVTGVTTDSRRIASGDLFVALRGERFDGHRFVESALDAGAAAALVSDPDCTNRRDAALLVAPDTRLAFGRLGAWWRQRFSLPVVGITGSNGKTTVKEMLAAILRAHAGEAAVLATQGNLNNDIGLPLMLLRMRDFHRYAVLEMGMNHLGEIRYLTCLARPGVALVNNAGTAHIGELGSRDNIAQAKAEIFEGVPRDGVRLFNADDDYAAFWAGVTSGRKTVTFGIDRPADITATCELTTDGSLVTLNTSEGAVIVRLQVPGLHNVRNAVAAAAAAFVLGVPLATISEGLGRHTGVQGRLQHRTGPGGSTVIDDTYNANPDSVRAAISWLATFGGRRILVMGDMGELGAGERALHAEIGRFARERGIDRFLALGNATRDAVEAFGAGAEHFDDVSELVRAALSGCDDGTTILVKGSRFMRMERVVERLCGDATTPEAH
ncbi:MAG: UDP-N-acetylmuramoyl-tripeptide--D-alanyl-D-alanine ligase [Betaproteobacteria bacterium]|nr:UDP-N-acetylmuramoyl-tripeptide--D-alanyl-D-alanine ligase [Betaproteobacteria bacterium]